MYDQREKAQRDYEWAMASVREEGIQQGIEQGIGKGIEQGIELGIGKGILAGKINILQELLNRPVAPVIELCQMEEAVLQALLIDLQQELRNR